MRIQLTKITLAAGFVLAMALTLSCSGDGGGGNTGETKYEYCITADNICLTGPFTASDCNGQLSNSCPYGGYSSSVGSSPSSDVTPSSSSIAQDGSSSSAIGSSSSVDSSSSIVQDNNSSSSVVHSSSSAVGSNSSNIEVSSSSAINANSGTFLDSRDNKTYKWVKIGTQTWMAENLNYEEEGSRCYENEHPYCNKYGRLYTWASARAVCPSGWHLPSNAEWDKLIRHVDGSTGTSGPYDSETAGKYLKATSGWYNSGSGLDTYGFSALPGGRCDSDGYFHNVALDGHWWSSSEFNSDIAYGRSMSFSNESTSWEGSFKYSSLSSIRCVQD